jgi:hypothetical protein
MFFNELIESIISFFQNHLVFSLVFGIALVYLLIQKTRVFITIFVIILFILGLAYLISDVSTTGVTYKEKLISKSVDVP